MDMHATSANVNSSGQLIITNGSVVVDTIGLSASSAKLAFAVVPDGVNDTTVLVGNNLQKLAVASQGIVLSGNILSVVGGGVATNTTVNLGSVLVSNGGVTNGTVLIGGPEYVLNGGVANNTVVDGPRRIVVYAGGVANNTTVNSGGFQFLYGGSASGGAINGFEYIYSGGVATGGTVGAGGLESVLSGGQATGATVNSGGQELVAKDGISKNTILNSGGILDFSAGAQVNGLHIKSGAIIDLQSIVATAVSINGSNQLVATNGGVTVVTIGLSAGTTGFTFSTKSDGSGGTDIMVSSGAAPAAAVTLFSQAAAGFAGQTPSGGSSTPIPAGASNTTMIGGISAPGPHH